MKNTSQQEGGVALALSPIERTIHAQRLLAAIDKLMGYQCASPARRIVTGSGKRVRGKFSSRRFGLVLCWESQLERAFIHQAQLSRQVAGIYAQPARLKLVCGDELIDYTPDFLVFDGNARFTFVECKPKDKLKSVALAQRINSIETEIRSADCGFALLTEEHLFDQVLQRNVSRLLEFVCPRNLTPGTWSGMASEVAEQQPSNYGGLAALLGRQLALVALANGLVSTNLREPLNDLSPILGNDEGGWDVANYL